MKELHLTGATMGYLVAAFALAQLIISPYAGRWVDQYGRKKIIVIGLFIFSLSELIFALGNDVWVLYLARILGGISAAFIMPGVTAFIADITTLDERPKALGYMSAAISTGFIIGPGIGGFLAEYGVRVPFFVAAIVAFIAAMISLIALKEPSNQAEREEALTINSNNSFFKEIKKSFQSHYFIAFIIIFVLALGLSAYETVFSLFSNAKFGFTPKDIAFVITVSSIIGVIAQIFLFDKLVAKMGEKALIQANLFIAAILAVVSTVIGSFWVVLAVTSIIFLAFDLLRPALTTYLSRTAGKDQGFVAGMNSTYTSLGNIVGPAVAGILFDVNIHAPYLSSAGIIVIGLMITFAWKDKVTVQS